MKKQNPLPLLNIKEGELNDPKQMARNVKNVGHWGNGGYEITVKDSDSFDYIVSLIRQSFDVNG